MEQIVLNVNLRFVLKTLDFEEKGRLLTALLEENEKGLGENLINIYQYILSLQEEKAKKRRKMSELSALAVAKKKLLTLDLFDENKPTVTDDIPAVTDGQTTGGKKENNNKINNNINKIIPSSDLTKVTQGGRAESESLFFAPKVEEVRAFVEQYQMAVNPEVFVDFYESHGWCVGKTPIKNWQATVRLWHRRALADRDKAEFEKTLVNEAVLSGLGRDGAGGAKNAKNEAFKRVAEVTLRAAEATAREAKGKSSVNDEEEYWHELSQKVRAYHGKKDDGLSLEQAGERTLPTNEIGERKKLLTTAPRFNDDTGKWEKLDRKGEEKNETAESPFARFMRRIEDNDILPEGK